MSEYAVLSKDTIKHSIMPCLSVAKRGFTSKNIKYTSIPTYGHKTTEGRNLLSYTPPNYFELFRVVCLISPPQSQRPECLRCPCCQSRRSAEDLPADRLGNQRLHPAGHHLPGCTCRHWQPAMLC